MKHALAPAALLPIILFGVAACSEAPPPKDNAALNDGGAAIATRPINIGTEGPSLPACPSVSRVIAAGTDVYWAPDETRVTKARLAGDVRVALCEATDDDRWFGVVFPAPGGDMDLCGVGRPVRTAREYQGPCRWGWIRGGTVRLGS
jgi:hypothetical protein